MIIFVLSSISSQLDKKGQSVIEYALIIILVIGGVYVMGPYIIRSWNANIKGWEDSVTDSRQDPLASRDAASDPNCQCHYRHTCKAPPCCGQGNCADVEASEVYVCNPVGCGGERPPLCQEDAKCCSSPVPLSVPQNCGTRGCKANEVPAIYYCGGEYPNEAKRVICQMNRNCQYQCLNAPQTGDLLYAKHVCPNDNLNLSANMNTTYIVLGQCSAPEGSAPKCEWECAPGFVPIEDGQACGCRKGYTIIGGKCVLDVLSKVKADCYSDTPSLDQIDGIPGCERKDCVRTSCEFEHKTLFSVGDTPNIMPDAYNFRNPHQWQVEWSGDECDLITGTAGNWCRMSGSGSWNVTAHVIHLPTGQKTSIPMKGTDHMDFRCQGKCPND